MTTSKYDSCAGCACGSKARQTPVCSAVRRRSGLISASWISRTPCSANTRAAKSPTDPPPKTKARVSLSGRYAALAARLTAWSAVAAGSVRAACAGSISSGMGIRLRAGSAMRSAKAPALYMPIRSRCAQRFWRPPRQSSHWPQVMSGLSTARPPVPGPSTTVPAASWPRISGGTRRGSCPR